MNANTIEVLCDPKLIEARERHFARMRNLFAGCDGSDTPFVLRGIGGDSEARPADDPEQKVAEALDFLASQFEASRDAEVFRPLVVEFGIYGVHFIDKILGATVFDLDGSWQVELLDTPVGELAPPDLDADQTWRLAKAIAEAFVSAGVTVPLFGLPTIGSSLNIGVNLYGQELLTAMMMRSEAAHRDLRVINDVLCAMHRWYLDVIPREQLQPVSAAWRAQPPGYGQLCGCTTQLLSPELYRDFIAPLDDELLRAYPHGGMIHLCGVHTQHIPVWREMKSVKCLQMNDRAAQDLSVYFEVMRGDQVFYVNTCGVMSVEETMEITGGERVVLVADIEGELPLKPGRRIDAAGRSAVLRGGHRDEEKTPA